MSVNKAIIIGNMCSDPQVRTFDNGGKIATFCVATNEKGFTTKDGRQIPDQTEYHNIVISIPGLVDVAEKYLHKGDKVYLEGKLRTRSFEDKQGVKKYTTEIVVSAIDLIGGRRQEETPAQQPVQQPTQRRVTTPAVPPQASLEPQGDDLPF